MGHDMQNSHAVTVEEIMRQINKRVAQERKRIIPAGQEGSSTIPPSLDDIVFKIQNEINCQKDMHAVNFQTRRSAANSENEHAVDYGPFHSHAQKGFDEDFIIKDFYELSDFLKLQDEAFLNLAYMAILGRVPDDNGRKHFLSCLRNGALTKTDILGRLRYSQEGRVSKVPVHGLLTRFCVNSLYKIPVLGYVIKVIAGVLTFPALLKNLQMFESRTSAQQNLLSQALESLSVQKADKQNVEDIRQVLEQVSVQKADSLRVEELQDVFTANIETIKKTMYEHTTIILDQQRRLNLLLEEAKNYLADCISNNKPDMLASEYEHAYDALYVLFEEKFRGTREDILQRLHKYVHYIQLAGAGTLQYPVLDLGCGRGEWLELLSDTGYTARGVDCNRVMLQLCRERNLAVEESDALAFLRGLPPGSLGALTSFHMIEHLPWKDVIALFDEAFRVLRPGGCIIFETPNPENIIVGSCTFYTDPSHVHPIPPATLAYLAQARGFIDSTIMRSSPLLFFDTPPDGEMARMMEVFNCGQDYAVIAYKKHV